MVNLRISRPNYLNNRSLSFIDKATTNWIARINYNIGMSKTRVADSLGESRCSCTTFAPFQPSPLFYIPAIIIIIITLRSVGIPHTRTIAPVRRLCTKTVRTCPPVRRISMIGRDNDKIRRKSNLRNLSYIKLFRYIEIRYNANLDNYRRSVYKYPFIREKETKTSKNV